jgi:hypothetical protein
MYELLFIPGKLQYCFLDRVLDKNRNENYNVLAVLSGNSMPHQYLPIGQAGIFDYASPTLSLLNSDQQTISSKHKF